MTKQDNNNTTFFESLFAISTDLSKENRGSRVFASGRLRIENDKTMTLKKGQKVAFAIDIDNNVVYIKTQDITTTDKNVACVSQDKKGRLSINLKGSKKNLVIKSLTNGLEKGQSRKIEFEVAKDDKDKDIDGLFEVKTGQVFSK